MKYLAEGFLKMLIKLFSPSTPFRGHLESVAEHMVFKDLLLFCWEGLVTYRTIQSKGLQVLLQDQVVIKNISSKV